MSRRKKPPCTHPADKRKVVASIQLPQGRTQVTVHCRCGMFRYEERTPSGGRSESCWYLQWKNA